MTKRALMQGCEFSWDRVDNVGCWSPNVASAAKGLKTLGYKLDFFKTGQLANAELSKSTVVKGSIHSVRTALWLLDVPQPENIDIPVCLRPFAEREVWETTLGKIRSKAEKVFIKPLKDQKAFDGYVFRSYDGLFCRESDSTNKLPNKFPVLASQPVSFLSEWRVYVLKGEIQGIKNYSGDFNLRVSRSKVEQMIRAFKKAPAGYAIDVGIMTDVTERYNPKAKKRTALIEVNEGFSIGNFGISNVKYAQILEARWKQMVRA
jgi:hypothetical protein